MDMALIAQAATPGIAHPLPALLRRLPHLPRSRQGRAAHRRTIMRAMIDENLVHAHRARALSPDRPVIRGTAQNPDVYFQAREACNSLLPGRPHHRAERHGQVRQHRRPPVSPVRLRGRAGCRARHRHDGLRRRSGARGRGSPASPPARRSACSRSACTGRSPIETFVAALPAIREIHRRPRPHQGTRRHRRAALLRRGHRPRRNGRQPRRSSAGATACPPRNSPPPW